MILEVIKARRSTRGFLPTTVSKEQLLLMLEAGRWAPSGGNQQPWRFLVTQERKRIEAIEAFSPGLRGNPPAVVVICLDTRAEGSSHEMDIAMAGQNMMLVATELGLGSCAVRSFNQKALQMLLGLPQHLLPLLLISVGYSAKPAKTPPKKPLEEIVHWEEFQAEETNEPSEA